MNNIESRVKSIIAEQLDIEIEHINLNSSLTDDLGADSLDVVELIMALEEDLGIEISDEDAEQFKTVQDAITYISEIN